jgi:hypothetical protein
MPSAKIITSQIYSSDFNRLSAFAPQGLTFVFLTYANNYLTEGPAPSGVIDESPAPRPIFTPGTGRTRGKISARSGQALTSSHRLAKWLKTNKATAATRPARAKGVQTRLGPYVSHKSRVTSVGVWPSI